MAELEDYEYFNMNNLQVRMDKCTNEQFWAVTTILAINAAFLSSEFAKSINLLMGILITILIITICGYGIWFVIKRHKSYYYYRSEFSRFLKKIEERIEVDKASILSKKPKKSSANTLSGVVFYVILIGLAGGISLTYIITTLVKSMSATCH